MGGNGLKLCHDKCTSYVFCPYERLDHVSDGFVPK